MRKSVVIDTDAFNEIDDQFALAYLLKSQEVLHTEAIYAAPFFNQNSVGPKDGMQKSYDEILKLLHLTGHCQLIQKTYLGCEHFFNGSSSPVFSQAVEHLAALAKQHSPENPLYVIAIAAATNIASALLYEPSIIPNIVVVWLGGNGYHWHNAKEFNLWQDLQAAKILFDSGVRMVHIPCMGVVSSMATTEPELVKNLQGKNQVCDYLLNVTLEDCRTRFCHPHWSRPLWDVAAVAYLVDQSFTLSKEVHSPILLDDFTYGYSAQRHTIEYVYHTYRDKIYCDLFTKLSQY